MAAMTSLKSFQLGFLAPSSPTVTWWLSSHHGEWHGLAGRADVLNMRNAATGGGCGCGTGLATARGFQLQRPPALPEAVD